MGKTHHSHHKFDVDALHQEAMERKQIHDREKPEKKDRTIYEVDVKASYEASIAALDEHAKDYDDQVAHIEEVLGAGPHRYDH